LFNFQTFDDETLQNKSEKKHHPSKREKGGTTQERERENQHPTRAVSHYGLAIYIKKYLKKAKEELWKFKYFTMQKYNLQKKSSKRNQNPSRYHNSIITNLKFQHKPNIIIFPKSFYQNKPTTYGPKSLKLLYSIMNLNTTSLPW
jgi:hypothetical protein